MSIVCSTCPLDFHHLPSVNSVPLSPLHKGTIVSAPSPLLFEALHVTCLCVVLGRYSTTFTNSITFVQVQCSWSHLLHPWPRTCDAAVWVVPVRWASSNHPDSEGRWWNPWWVITTAAARHICLTMGWILLVITIKVSFELKSPFVSEPTTLSEKYCTVLIVVIMHSSD